MRFFLLVLCLALTTILGCNFADGPRIRVATATSAELEAVKDEDKVWYEFREGDEVPVNLAFFGVMEGGTEGAAFRAKKTFYFVMFKNGPMQISFDGKSFSGPNSSQSIIAVVPRKDGKGGQLGWLIYMGESGNPQAELKSLLDKSDRSEKPEAASEEAEAQP